VPLPDPPQRWRPPSPLRTGGSPEEDKQERQVLSTKRVIGIIQDWRGVFGWIKPNAPVDHPLVKGPQKGLVYLSAEDVQDELEGVGALVSFLAFADARGVGAMNVRPAIGGRAPSRRGEQALHAAAPEPPPEEEEEAPGLEAPGGRRSRFVRGPTPPSSSRRATASTAAAPTRRGAAAAAGAVAGVAVSSGYRPVPKATALRPAASSFGVRPTARQPSPTSNPAAAASAAASPHPAAASAPRGSCGGAVTRGYRPAAKPAAAAAAGAGSRPTAAGGGPAAAAAAGSPGGARPHSGYRPARGAGTAQPAAPTPAPVVEPSKQRASLQEVQKRVQSSLYMSIWTATEPIKDLEVDWPQQELVKRIVKYFNKGAQSPDLVGMPWASAARRLVENAMSGYSAACGDKPWFFELDLAPALSHAAWEVAKGCADGASVNYPELEEVTQGAYDDAVARLLLDKALWDSTTSIFGNHKLGSKIYGTLNKGHAPALAEALSDPTPVQDLTRVEIFLQKWIENSMSRAWQAVENSERLVTENNVTKLFARLVAPFGEDHPFSCIPAELTEGTGRPPHDWPFVRAAVREVLAAWRNPEPVGPAAKRQRRAEAAAAPWPSARPSAKASLWRRAREEEEEVADDDIFDHAAQETEEEEAAEMEEEE